MRRKHFLGAAVFILLCLLLLLPWLSFLFAGLGGIQEALQGISLRDLRLLLQSLAWTALASALALLGSLPCALRVMGTSHFRRVRISILALSFLMLPPIQGYVWAGLIAQASSSLLSIGFPTLSAQGYGIYILISVLAYLPMATALTALSLMLVDPEPLEAGRLFRGEAQVLRTLLLPQVMPYLATIFLLLWMLQLQDFSMPSLFSVQAYSMHLFACFSAQRNYSILLLQVLPWILIVLGLTGLGATRLGRLPGYRPGGPSKLLGGLNPLKHHPHWAHLIDVFLVLPVLAPLGLGISGWDGALWKSAWVRAWPDLMDTLLHCGSTALGSLVAGCFFGRAMSLFQKPSTLFLAIFGIPLLLPSLIPAVGLLRLLSSWPEPWNALGPHFLGLSRTLPMVTCLIFLAHQRRDPGLWEAASLLEARPWRRFVLIELPQLAPAALAGGLLSFNLMLGESGALILLLPPGKGHLALRLYNLLHYGSSPEVAALSTLLSGVSATAALAGLWALWKGTAMGEGGL